VSNILAPVDYPTLIPAPSSVAPAQVASANSIPTGRLELLQVLRAVAVFSVVLYHVNSILIKKYGGPEFLNGIFDSGYAGVDLFFVLSGFVIALTHWNDIGRRDRVGRYTLRRVIRILPLYWLVVGSKLVLGPVLGITDAAAPTQSEVVRGLLLLPQAHSFSTERMLGLSWTLTFEMLFYVGFGLCMAFGRRFVIGISAGALLLCQARVLGLFSLADDAVLPSLFSHQVIFEFFFGVAIAWAYRNRFIWCPRLLVAMGIVSSATSVAGYQSGIFTDNQRMLTFGLSAALLVAGCVGMETARPRRVPKFLIDFGDASYATYLAHGSTIAIVAVVLRKFPLLGGSSTIARDVIGVACVVAACVTGHLLHTRVEKPILRGLRKLFAV
jgi:exopolysaccharide production protein ExoZ